MLRKLLDTKKVTKAPTHQRKKDVGNPKEYDVADDKTRKAPTYQRPR